MDPAPDRLDRTLPAEALLSAAVEANVRWTLRQVIESPEWKARMTRGDALQAVGAVYEISTGRARFLK